MENKQLDNKAEKPRRGRKPNEKKQEQPKAKSVKIIGVKAPLAEGVEYMKKPESAKVLVEAGAAKYA